MLARAAVMTVEHTGSPTGAALRHYRAFLADVVEACDVDAKTITLPPWPVREGESASWVPRMIVETLAATESTHSRLYSDEAGAAELRGLRTSLAAAVGYKPAPVSRDLFQNEGMFQ
jgi:hypothetical protein